MIHLLLTVTLLNQVGHAVAYQSYVEPSACVMEYPGPVVGGRDAFTLEKVCE